MDQRQSFAPPFASMHGRANLTLLFELPEDVPNPLRFEGSVGAIGRRAFPSILEL